MALHIDLEETLRAADKFALWITKEKEAIRGIRPNLRIQERLKLAVDEYFSSEYPSTAKIRGKYNLKEKSFMI